MAERKSIADESEPYIDESGRTSMEPEGPGKHPHILPVYPDPGSKERWENDFGGKPGGDGYAYPRGPEPAEGGAAAEVARQDIAEP